MLFIVISMLVIVAVAGLVVTFVAFPHRGEEVPGAPWLGDTMNRAAGAMPLLGEDAADEPEERSGLIRDRGSNSSTGDEDHDG